MLQLALYKTKVTDISHRRFTSECFGLIANILRRDRDAIWPHHRWPSENCLGAMCQAVSTSITPYERWVTA